MDGRPTAFKTKEEVLVKINNNDIASLAHSKWRCQYHIVFRPNIDDGNL